MAKDHAVVTAELPGAELVVCDNCKSDRLQIHERGKVKRVGNALSVAYDELALQCLSCHHIMLVPVTGVIDYTAPNG